MKKNFLKYLLMSISLMTLFSACRKDSYVGTETGESGKSFVRITEAPVYSQFFAPFLTVKPVTMFSVRRDAASTTEQNTPRSVVLTAIPNYITTYNTKNGTSYSAMPSTLYTVQADPSIVATATGFTFNFAAGDFAKNLVFKIDGSQVDLSKQYAVAYTISDPGGLTKKAGLDTIVATVAIKNKYDGVYTTSGTMVDITNTTLQEFNVFLASATNTTGVPAPQEIELRTTSANTCDVYDNYFYGGYYFPIASGTSYSQYGSFCPTLTFDLATDKITAVGNHYGNPASNGRYGKLDPTGTVNAYESGKITIKFNMVGGSGVTANQVRTTWDEVWKFKKSR
jgi:hypothetical protein